MSITLPSLLRSTNQVSRLLAQRYLSGNAADTDLVSASSGHVLNPCGFTISSVKHREVLSLTHGIVPKILTRDIFLHFKWSMVIPCHPI
jgi:hypothetical protein